MRVTRRYFPFLYTFFLIIFSGSLLFAQTEKLRGIELKDGSIIDGKITKMNASEVIIETKDGKTLNYKFDDVQSFVKNEEAKPAQSSIIARHGWKIGPEISYIEYKEPDVMKEKGIMYGLGGSYTYHNDIMLKAEAKFSYGQVDYQNSGTMNNINDFITEIRGIGGYDFKLTESLIITPYIGFGYRYLRDDSSGKRTSDGSWGYLRESNYFYSPVGATLYKDFNNSWTAGLTLEYDIFWKGKQKSYISNVSSSYSDLDNTQNSGYGLRGSFFVKKITGKISYSLEPFIIYWNIDKSDVQTITYNGTIWGYGWEPKNNSTEIGLKFIVEF